MAKRKKWIISILSVIGAGIIAFFSFFGLRVIKNRPRFSVKDTLADGQGKKATVILLGGQSNASGCSSVEYLEKNVSPERYAQFENGFDNVYINYYVSDENISNEFVKCSVNQGEFGTCFGPELGMAEKLSEMYPDQTFFIIKCAWGGTELFDKWLSPSSYTAKHKANKFFYFNKTKTGKLYEHFVSFVKTSLKYLKSKNYDISVEGMCWMQGESDSFETTHATNYETHLTNFIKDIRKQFKRFSADDGLAFIDAYIAHLPAYWVYGDLVNASKKAVAESSPLNALVDTIAHGLTTDYEPTDAPDRAHYDSLSEIKLGHLFIETLAQYL